MIETEESEAMISFLPRDEVLKEACFSCDIPEKYCRGLDTYEQCKAYYDECLRIKTQTNHKLTLTQRLTLELLLEYGEMPTDEVFDATMEEDPEHTTTMVQVSRRLQGLHKRGLVYLRRVDNKLFWGIRKDQEDTIAELLNDSGKKPTTNKNKVYAWERCE